MSQNLQNFAKFQNFQLDNLVDFEKCCKTHIFLQKSVPIQPKTSNILPKICEKLTTTLREHFDREEANRRRANRRRSSSTRGSGSRSVRRAVDSTRGGGSPAREGSGVGGFSKLRKVRSRLYRSQFLQVNMRLKALAEIYTMHSFAQL